jgi:hypothetical protein
MIAEYTGKLRFVLDAMIIIKAHELAIWEELKSKIPIVVPSIVVKNEAFYFDTVPGERRFPINLAGDIASGIIEEEAATPTDLNNLLTIFDSNTTGMLHDGEIEALALIYSGRLGNALFCTSDIPAIRALALMNCPDNGISFEEILKNIGLQKPLDPQYTRSFFNQHLSRGRIDRITRTGLRNL